MERVKKVMKKYELLPEELKELKQWVNVCSGSKVPMQSFTDFAASSVDKKTWSTFQSAVSAEFSGRYQGIGFIFSDDDPYVGIDIDDGFKDGLLSDLAINIMRACQSYTEKSRSGRGIHIILKGKLPFNGKNNRFGVEIYQSRRYFIMTGKRLIYPEIVENQEAIDYVIKTYFPDTEKEGSDTLINKIYKPIYPKLAEGRIALRPYYPPIQAGSRNISLTSLAGQMHSQGYAPNEIYNELLFANRQACNPILPESEIRSIVNSVTRYRR